jgi:hypothetical protein
MFLHLNLKCFTNGGRRKKKMSDYPELDKVAKIIARETIKRINDFPVYEIKSEMPYKRQHILEETIKILESAI